MLLGQQILKVSDDVTYYAVSDSGVLPIDVGRHVVTRFSLENKSEVILALNVALQHFLSSLQARHQIVTDASIQVLANACGIFARYIST